MSRQKITNASADQKYFVLTPQIVWAQSRDPYDYTLWNVIKMIAGDEGECYLSTEDLATLSMMSTGKVSDCRAHLIKQGLLKGEVRKDPGYPQPVWHLRVPNIWRKNIEWRETHDSLSSRVQWKQQQKESLHQMKPSPDEEGTSPDEEGTSPDETKNNQTDNQRKTTLPGGNEKGLADKAADSKSLTDLPNLTPEEELDYFFDAATPPANGKESAYRDAEQQIVGWSLSKSMHDAAVHFIVASGIRAPRSDRRRGKWATALREHIQEYGESALAYLYPAAIERLRQSKGDNGQRIIVSWPGALTNTLPDVEAEMDGRIESSHPTKEQLEIIWNDTGERLV